MINLEIVTPERKVVSESVETVMVPTANGEIGILPSHAPLISTLRSGVLSYTSGGTTSEMVVSGGFVEVSADKVSVLADIAEVTNEIDIENAKTEREEAEKLLGEWNGSEEEFEVELERLEKAQARLLLSGKN
ncbi:MAG: F0F1 ATP synthase subunit epsilon [Pyrinomonadaceae bacterium]|nr:F0F1 ATP synthase subunit epsilon [Pyrinomonadaceae bacterium]